VLNLALPLQLSDASLVLLATLVASVCGYLDEESSDNTMRAMLSSALGAKHFDT